MEAVQTTFDYGALDPETRIVVQQRTSEIKSLMRRAAQDIIDIGEKLTEVKTKVGHGGFGLWLADEFGWSHMTAARMMGVAEDFKDNNLLDLKIAPSALYVLTEKATPQSARDEVLQRAEAGEAISYSEARAIVADHRERQIESIGPGVAVRPAPNLDEALSEEAVSQDFAPGIDDKIRAAEAAQRVLGKLISARDIVQQLAAEPIPEGDAWRNLQCSAVRSAVSQIVDAAYAIAEQYNQGSRIRRIR